MINKDDIRKAILKWSVCERLYQESETVDPCVITPSEINEVVDELWTLYERSK